MDLLPFHGECHVPMDDDKWLHFKKRGLHFIHLNMSSLLSEIDELGEIVKRL